MRPAPLPQHSRFTHAGLRRRLAQTSALAGLLVAAPALGQANPPTDLPTGGSSPALLGGATFDTTVADTLTVNLNATRSVINWATFDVASGKTVNFADTRTLPLPVPMAVLNRVVGSVANPLQASTINGNVNAPANVAVYILNPQGMIFGPNANFSVGSLIATTRDIAGPVLANDTGFDSANRAFLGATGTLNFAGVTTAAIRVDPNNANKALNAIGNLATTGNARGIIALIAAKIDTQGTLTAAGEVALVAADDTTINLESGSPLAVTILKGATLANPATPTTIMLATNRLTGSSIVLAGATRTGVTNALLDIQATMVATTARATDQGIVLSAGKTAVTAAVPANAVTFSDGSRAAPADNTGLVAVQLGGTLTATGTAGSIDVRANNGIAAPTAVGAARAVLADDQSVLVHTDAGGIVLGNVTGNINSTTANGVAITTDAGAIDVGAVSTAGIAGVGGSAARVVATGGAVTLIGLTADRAASLSGTAVTVNGLARSVTSTLNVTSTTGGITATGLRSAGTMTIGAAGNLVVDAAVTDAAAAVPADLTVNAVGVGGRSTTAASLTAGRNLNVTATGATILSTASGGAAATLSAPSLTVSSLSAGTGILRASATNGVLALTDTSSGSDTILRAAGATGAITSGGLVKSTGSLDVSAPAVTLNLVEALTSSATLTATGGALGVTTVRASTITATASGALTATGLTASANTGVALRATGATLGIDSAIASTAGGSVVLSATGGAARVGILQSGLDATLTATATSPTPAIATLTGNATASRDLIVSGTEIRLGGATAASQQAGRNAVYTASTGTIAKATGAAGVSIGADTDATDADTGAVILDANTGINLPGVGVATRASGSGNTGDVAIRLATAASPLTLGTVNARALLSTNAAHDTFTAFTTTGAVTLGATRLVNALSLSTPRTITLDGIAISGTGQTLSIEGTDTGVGGASPTGVATTVTSTGALTTADGTITVLSPGEVKLAAVTATGGNASIRSSAANLTAGAVTGQAVTATAQTALVLDSVTANAASAATGTATLTSTTQGIKVTNKSQATGTLTFDAPGVIDLGDVESTASTIVVQSSSATPVTGTLKAKAVKALASFDIARAAGVTFDSATSVLGSITLGSTNTVQVFNATTASTSATSDVQVTAGTVLLGDVSATAGRVGLLSQVGGVTAGAIRAEFDVGITARTDAQIASIDTDVLGVLGRAQGAFRITGATNAQGVVDIGAPGLVSVGAVTSRGQTALVASSGASVATGVVTGRNGVTVRGATTATVGGASSSNGGVTLQAVGDRLQVTGAVTATGGAADLDAGTTLGATAVTGRSVTVDAPGAIVLSSVEATATTAAIKSTGGGITVSGLTRASGTVTIDAPLAISLGDVTSTNDTVLFRSTTIAATGAVGAGAVTAQKALTVARGAGVTFTSARSVDESVDLRSATGTVRVSGATQAKGEVFVDANAVALGSVTSGEDRAFLRSATSLSAGDVKAADLVTVSGQTTTSVTGAESTLDAVTLAGNGGTLTATGPVKGVLDVQATAAGIVSLRDVTSTQAVVTLRSTGSSVTAGAVKASARLAATAQTTLALASAESENANVDLNAGTTLDVTNATIAQTIVSAVAAGKITTGDVTARTGTLTLNSTAGDVVARDLASGDTATVTGSVVGLRSVTSTKNVALTARSGGLTVSQATSGQTGVVVGAAGAATLGDVTANAGAVSLTGSSVGAGAVFANDALGATGPGGITLASARSVQSTVTLTASAGPVTVSNLTRASRDVAVGARDAITLGDVTSDIGAVTIASSQRNAAAGTIQARNAIDVSGLTGVGITGATSDLLGVALRSGSGGATASALVRAKTNALVDVNGAIALAGVTADTGSVTLLSTTGTIGAGAIDAATDVEVRGQGDLGLGTIDARGTATGGRALLVSRGGAITTPRVTTRTTLGADAATTLSLPLVAVGTAATLAGRDVVLGTIGAGALDATARLGSLSIEAGDIRGTTTLTKTGATGAISIARLTATGPTTITSAGAVRADLLQGGATTVNAVGDVSGRTGGLGAATVASLTVSAGGNATIGAVTTGTGDVNVSATGATFLTGAIASANDLIASGAGVTLGTVGQSVTQTARGAVQVSNTSASGAITGIGGLRLRSDTLLSGTRDVTLRSAGGIAFQPDTLIAGGTDRQSALRLVAADGASIVLDAVEARTIASSGVTTALAHRGPVSITRAATRDSLTIDLTSAPAAAALTIGSVEVRAGNLILDTLGALTIGAAGVPVDVDVPAGATTLRGATVASEAIASRGLTAQARSGAATFTTIDTGTGGASVTAAADIRLTRATTTGALALTSAGGDVAGPGSTAAVLTGGTVSVRANATDGTHGLVRVGAVSGTDGVDLGGRSIVAETLASANGGVVASTRRDGAGITDQSMTIGTIDALRAITLTTGNTLAVSNAPIALDRATTTGGSIAITTIGGGFAARSGSPRTILSAPDAGAITLDIGGAAVLGATGAGNTTIAATSLDLTTVAANAGTLSLTTRGGPLALVTGTATAGVTIAANGLLTATTIAGASATLTGSGNATLGSVLARSGDLSATVVGAFDALSLDGARAIVVDAGSARITDANARLGALTLTTRTGLLRLDTGRAGGLATLVAPTLSLGTLDAGSASLTAASDVTADRVTTSGILGVTAGNDATLTTIAGGGATTLGATRNLAVTSVTTPAALTLSGRSIATTTVQAGSLGATAGVGGADLRTTRVTNAATVTSGGVLTLDTFDAGSATLTAAGDIVANRLTATGALSATAGRDATLTTVQGGATTLSATRTLAIDNVAASAALTLSASRIAVRALTAGSLAATAGSAGFDLRGGTVTAAATIRSDAGVAIGTLTAGSADIGATTDLTADTLRTGGTLAARAGNDATITTVDSTGNATLAATRTLTIADVTTPAALSLAGRGIAVTTLGAGTLGATAGTDGIGLGTATVAGLATIASDAGVTIGTLDAGTIGITAAGALVADTLAAGAGLDLTAASAQIRQTNVTGGAIRMAIGTGGLALTGLTAAGDVDLATGGVLSAGALDIGGRLTASGASATFATTRVRGDAALSSSVGDLGIGTATIDGATTLSAANDLTIDRITIGGTLDARAAGLATITDATVQGAAAVTADGIAIATFATPALLTLTGERIDATTLGAGALTLRAGSGGATLGTATVAGLADVGSDAGLTIGTLATGTTRIAATGALAADLLTARAGLSATAGSMRVDRTTVTAGDAALATTVGDLGIGTIATSGDLGLTSAAGLTVGQADIGGGLAASGLTATFTTARVGGGAQVRARGGDLTLGSATVGGAATLAATGTIAIDALDVVGDLLGEAAAIRIGDGVVRTGNARLTASGDAIRIGTASVAGDTALTAAGLIDAGTLASGRTLGATGGSIAFRRASAGGTATLAARDAAITLGEGRFAADAALTARAAITADLLSVGTTLNATAASIALTNATIGRAATINVGAANLGTFASGDATTLTASGAAAIDTLRVGGRFAATTGSLSVRSATVTGDAALTGQTVALGSATVGGGTTVDAATRFSADTLDVGGRLTATTAALALGNATVRGGDATFTVGAADIGTLSASAAIRTAAQRGLTATRLDAGSTIDARVGSATIGQATARGGDVAIVTTAGDIRLGTGTASGAVALTSSGATGVTGAVTAGTSYRIDAATIALGTTGATARQAGADVTLLARTGAIAAQGTTTLAGTRVVALTANGATGAITFAPDTTITSSAADVALATTGAAALGTVSAAAGAIRVGAADAVLTRAVSAQAITLTNVAASGVTRLGDTGVGNETEFAAPTVRFDLNNAEIGLVSAPTVTIASGARDVMIGAVALNAATGATRFAITANGRVDMLGRFVAAGSTASRTIAIGNDIAGGRTGVIRIAATQGEGGRLLVDNAALELNADRIGGGLDRDFLDTIGYRGAGIPVEQATREYVARPTSTLYQPSALGAQPYTDQVTLRAGTLKLTYGRYALFQNTGRPGEERGVVLGNAGSTGGGAVLRLTTPGSATNAFALFGTIDGISSQATALLGPDRLSVDPAVNPVASRINGCVIGSGGGCLNTSIAQPTLNLFDTSRAEIVRTADDLTLPFDPLIGTNNEALYLDTETDAASTATECEGDKPCPTKP